MSNTNTSSVSEKTISELEMYYTFITQKIIRLNLSETNPALFQFSKDVSDMYSSSLDLAEKTLINNIDKLYTQQTKLEYDIRSKKNIIQKIFTFLNQSSTQSELETIKGKLEELRIKLRIVRCEIVRREIQRRKSQSITPNPATPARQEVATSVDTPVSSKKSVQSPYENR